MKLHFQLCLCLLALAARQAVADEQRLGGANGLIRAAMTHWEVPGAAIAVVKDGEVVFAKGYGVRELGSDEPVETTTLFDVASCTKSFTAASVAVLVDQGKLDWDDPVTKYLPNIRFSDEYMTRHATLRDLLCHRTGLERGDMIFSQKDINRREILRRIESLKVETPFRTQHTYSNVMYAVLKEVVGTASKQPWERFVEQHLFEPLAMSSTTISLEDQDRHNFAPRHWQDEGRITSRGVPDSGGVYSSADDIAKWLKCQLALGRRGDRQVISKQAVREMHALQHSIPLRRTPEGNPYAARFYGAGFGWMTLDYRGRKLLMHTGAWGAIMGLVPDENVGVVVLTNLDWDYGMTTTLMFRVLDSYCSESEAVWRTDNFTQPYVEAPGQAYQIRDRERAKLDASRAKKTKHSLPLAKYTGNYRSSFFGDIQIIHKDNRLSLRIGRFTTPLTHWENDVFYAKSPTRSNYDWLVQFDVKDGGVNEVTLKYVGWHEPNAVFQRVSKGE